MTFDVGDYLRICVPVGSASQEKLTDNLYEIHTMHHGVLC
jgi:hypothetical protein